MYCRTRSLGFQFLAKGLSIFLETNIFRSLFFLEVTQNNKTIAFSKGSIKNLLNWKLVFTATYEV